MSNKQDFVTLTYEVPPEQAGVRLDVVITDWLKELEESEDGLPRAATRTKVAEWIQAGLVSVDGKVVEKSSYRTSAGESLAVRIPPPEPMFAEPDSSVVLDIIHEDADVLVLNKPAGIAVHPGAGNKEKTLVHGLLAHLGTDLKNVGDAVRPGLVHRLDKDTTGVMVVAKNERSYHSLVKQFVPPRTVSREYLALTTALPGTSAAARKAAGITMVSMQSGRIDAPIGRHPTRRKEMAVVPDGKPAVSFWEVEMMLERGALLRVRLETGRTHQIRVHLAHAGSPVVGDQVYGKAAVLNPALRSRAAAFGRQALHAAKLQFLHPATGQKVAYVAPMPSDMLELIAAFQR